MSVDTKIKPITMPSYGGGQIRLEGLTPEENEILQASFKGGHHWVRKGNDGRIEFVPSFKPLPGPTDDVSMMPFWEPARPEAPVQMQLFDQAEADRPYEDHYGASITIQHLCGYGFTAEKYKEEAELLESYGFECLRSRRGLSGQFWELWFLPGTWCAKGRLKEAVEDHVRTANPSNEKSKTTAAVRFLQKNASFGTLEVSVQRLALVMDD